ncbi:MAG TPA: hypothetical protein H9859_06175 [Candidatus Barnesiella excrementigallinarum]|nr:hypothetical protein [Candidatus Barnesiella excrementigallinarum]
MDRSRYRIIDKNEEVWRGFCAIVIYLALLCILPWSNFGLWNLLDYSSMSMEEVREQSREIKLRWSTDMRVVGIDGKEVVRKVPAGTTVRLLAICYDLPDEPVLLSYKPWAEYQIELPDGTRGFAVVPEAAAGLEVKLNVDGELKPFRVERVERLSKNPMKSEKKQSDYPYLYHLDNGEELAFEPIYWPIRGQMPIYTSKIKGEREPAFEYMVAFAEDLEGLKGDSLTAIENRYVPAHSVTVKGSRKYAFFPNVNVLQNDSLLYFSMRLVFENDTLADYQLSEEKMRMTRFLSKAVNSHIRINPNDVKAGYYEAYPLSGSIGSRCLPRWAARGIAGLADTLLLLVLAFFIPWLLEHTLFHIRPLPNKLLKFISVLCVIVIFHLYLFYFSTPSVNMFFVYVGIAVAWMLVGVNVSVRCPYCHRVNSLRFMGEGDSRVVVTVDEHDESRLLSRKVERHGNTLVIKDTVDEYVEKETTAIEHYYSYYRCSHCGKTVRHKGRRRVGSSVEYKDKKR